jgi:LacI family transcriptional regulator
MGDRVTVYHIAEALGISSSTVSRVLNNSTLISDEKSLLIRETAEKMGYRKRSIRRQKDRTILNIKLFLPSAQYSYIHLFYDVADLIAGIQEGFGEVKVNIITRLNDWDDTIFSNKKMGDIDGAIFAFSRPDEKLAAVVREREIPMILLNRPDEAGNFVMYDNRLGMRRLLGELYKQVPDLKPCYLGFRPIQPVSTLRGEGVKAACEELNIPFGPTDMVELGSIEEIDPPFIRSLQEGGYNALLAFNDLVAVYLYQAALHGGVRIPEAFSLTGFDNSPVRSLISAKIDTINLSIHRLGVEAGSWLRSYIVERNEEPIKKRIEGEYVPGTTIARGPVGNSAGAAAGSHAGNSTGAADV